MDVPAVEQVRQRVLANWTDPQTVAAWRRWHSRITRQQQHVSDALLAAISPLVPRLDNLDIGPQSRKDAQ